MNCIGRYTWGDTEIELNLMKMPVYRANVIKYCRFSSNSAKQNTKQMIREEFNRIFKVHKKYEDFLEEHSMTNGEVDIAYRIIKDSYERHMRNHNFVEDIRGYNE